MQTMYKRERPAYNVYQGKEHRGCRMTSCGLNKWKSPPPPPFTHQELQLHTLAKSCYSDCASCAAETSTNRKGMQRRGGEPQRLLEESR